MALKEDQSGYVLTSHGDGGSHTIDTVMSGLKDRASFVYNHAHLAVLAYSCAPKNLNRKPF